MAYFTLFLFTKGEATHTPQKLIRNKIYKVSGYVMHLYCNLDSVLRPSEFHQYTPSQIQTHFLARNHRFPSLWLLMAGKRGVFD
jgi:hypothetical protein